MIDLVQRLLQLIVLIGFVVIIARPALLPDPARVFAENVHVWIMGETDSWESMQTNWKQRFEQAGTLIPWFKQLATTIPPEPPQITADSILELFNRLIITQPIHKFETIKDNLLLTPSASSPAEVE
jgi:hypothetical protein